MAGSVLSIKTIKPQKMKIDEVRLELLNALRAEAKDTIAEYKKTVATWRNPPEFTEAISLAGGDASVLVTPDGPHRKQFEYVDLGTVPHIIRPVRATILRFRTGYSAKTSPGVIGSTGGGASGDVVYRPQVFHPGTEARRFSEIIQQRRKDKYRERILGAMRRGMEKANGE